METTTEEEEPRVTFRQQWKEANDPVEDFLGRKNLHSFGLATWIKALVLPLGIPFNVIPGEFWSLDTDAEGFTTAVVACPCGESPSVNAGTWVTCACERAYAYTGTEVYVINSQRGRVEPEGSAAA